MTPADRDRVATVIGWLIALPVVVWIAVERHRIERERKAVTYNLVTGVLRTPSAKETR